jgi:hypothetical protein
MTWQTQRGKAHVSRWRRFQTWTKSLTARCRASSEREKQRDLRAITLVISAQREHLWNVRRSGQLARYLAIIKKRMDGASNLTSAHAVARQAEAVMLEENSDWFLTMEGHDFELHDAVRPATCDETSS